MDFFFSVFPSFPPPHPPKKQSVLWCISGQEGSEAGNQILCQSLQLLCSKSGSTRGGGLISEAKTKQLGQKTRRRNDLHKAKKKRFVSSSLPSPWCMGWGWQREFFGRSTSTNCQEQHLVGWKAQERKGCVECLGRWTNRQLDNEFYAPSMAETLEKTIAPERTMRAEG